MFPFRVPSKAAAPAPEFGYAVIGLGKIAETFLKAIADSPRVHAAAMVSGNGDKARDFARRYGAANAYTYAEFDRIVDDPAVHGVYIALPVTLHREFTERAAAAGKHVLCEKPMAASAADCHAMIAACRAANVRLSIAYRCPYDATHQRARELVRSGVLGTIQRIQSQFGFALEQGWRMDASQGGSLYDVGIYPLNAIRYLLGAEPSGVGEALATCDPSGLEQAITWTTAFPSGYSAGQGSSEGRIAAHMRSSYLERLQDTLHITADHGTLTLDPAFSHRARFHLQARYTDAATGKLVTVDEQTPRNAPSQFRLEAEELAVAAAANRDPITPGEDGLRDLEAIEQIYRAAGVNLPRG